MHLMAVSNQHTLARSHAARLTRTSGFPVGCDWPREHRGVGQALESGDPALPHIRRSIRRSIRRDGYAEVGDSVHCSLGGRDGDHDLEIRAVPCFVNAIESLNARHGARRAPEGNPFLCRCGLSVNMPR